MKLIFDIESNGFLHEADRLWVISTLDLDTGEMRSFYGLKIHQGIRHLKEAEELIGHNIIGYDLQLLKKLHDFTYDGKVFDTYVMSCLLNPDREGGHGIESWAKRLGGEQKYQVDDWTTFSMEKVERCESDVRLNHKVYNALQREMWEPVEGIQL